MGFLDSKYFNTNELNTFIDNACILHFNGRKIYKKNIDNNYKEKLMDIYKKYDLTNVL